MSLDTTIYFFDLDSQQYHPRQAESLRAVLFELYQMRASIFAGASVFGFSAKSMVLSFFRLSKESELEH